MSYRCIICGRVPWEYYQDFRGNKICASHDSVPQCVGCGCFILDKNKSQHLSANEYLCETCQKNHVTTMTMKTYIDKTLQILYEVGFRDIQKDWIKVSLMSRAEMNQKIKFITASGFHCEITPSTVSVRGRYDFNQQVCILDHLSPIEFMQVFAHEILHAWQLQNNINDYIDYDTDIFAKRACEGFANLGSYIIYDYFDSPKFNPEIRNFVRFKKSMMEKNTDDIYGLPFRKIINSQDKNDKGRWHKLIKAARESKIKNLVL